MREMTVGKLKDLLMTYPDDAKVKIAEWDTVTFDTGKAKEVFDYGILEDEEDTLVLLVEKEEA